MIKRRYSNDVIKMGKWNKNIALLTHLKAKFMGYHIIILHNYETTIQLSFGNIIRFRLFLVKLLKRRFHHFPNFRWKKCL